MAEECFAFCEKELLRAGGSKVIRPLTEVRPLSVCYCSMTAILVMMGPAMRELTMSCGCGDRSIRHYCAFTRQWQINFVFE
jgi:hypothetical protein